MLALFRRYQKIIYIIITAVIVVSFSFFGTYSTLERPIGSDPVVFTAVDGRAVHRLELEEMMNFLSTDADDKIFFQGRWGPNFLNDGVLVQDFLRSGIALPLIEAFKEDFQEPLTQKLHKEKLAKSYQHPQGKFLSAVNVWTYFAPEMKRHYEVLVASQDPLAAEALQARVDLFLAQKAFGPMMLRQVLKYQMQQYPWLAQDPNLERGDLSLFGYHTVEDWLGRPFTRLAAQLVINGAALAQKKGYVVSREEAWAELLNNARTSYSRLRSQPNFKVPSPEAYLEEQLRQMHLDKTLATDIWRQVLLFRRLIKDVGGAALVDATVYQDFVHYAKQGAEGEIYRLPVSLRLADPYQLERLDLYLDRMAKGKKDYSNLPTEFITVAEAIKKSPELVQKHYSLKVAEVHQKSLLARITVREVWDWELTHWDVLKKEFPDLGASKSEGRDERFTLLEKLDAATRNKIDIYARQKILAEHPDWLKEALAVAEKEPREISLYYAGAQQLPGVTDPKALMALLDKAPTDGTMSKALESYSPNGEITYAIEVVNNSQSPEILLFAEASDQGLLDKILEKELEAHYIKIREQNRTNFIQANGEWKPLTDVAKEVSLDRFSHLFKDLPGTPTEIASKKLLPYMQKVREKIIAKSSTTPLFRDVSAAEEDNGARPQLKDQWVLLKSLHTVDRSNPGDSGLESEKILAMKQGDWSAVSTPSNGDLAFFRFDALKQHDDVEAVAEKVLEGHKLLSTEALQTFFRVQIANMKEKGELSLDLFKKDEES